jgi:hypothetical protein
VATPGSEIRDWMQSMEHVLRALQRQLVASSDAELPAHADWLEKSFRRLDEVYLSQLARVYWVQDASLQPVIRPAYLDALETLKRVMDDFYVERVELARHGPGADRATVVIGKDYLHKIGDWIAASPMLRSRALTVRERVIPSFRYLPYLPELMAEDKDPQLDDLISRGRIAFSRDVSRALATPDRTPRGGLVLGREARHLLGLACLLLQWRLVVRGDFEIVETAHVRHWYTGTLQAIETLRRDVVDLFGALEREALSKQEFARARFHRRQDRRYHALLADLYSLRGQRTPVLFTVFHDVHRGDVPFEMSDEVLGANGVSEIISSYAGDLNPDAQEGRDVISVDFLLDDRANHIGKKRVVFGLLSRRGDFVNSVVRARRRLRFRRAEDFRFRHADRIRRNPRDRRILVEGQVVQRGRRIELDSAQMQRHANAYEAFAGSRRLFHQGARRPLVLRPPWRRTSEAMRRHAAREQAVPSILETIVGQDRLVRDLMWHRKVRAFAGHRRSDLRLDLRSREQRVRAWRVVFRKRLSRTKSRDRAFRELLRLLQRYLMHYTRHTYFNVRDDDPSYLESRWPEDVTGRSFFDCGVYATTMAYEIFRVVEGMGSAQQVEFQYVTFLNHICIVGYFGNSAFLINNDQILQPLSTGKRGSPQQRKVNAALNFAQRAFATAHDVRFSITPVVIPRVTITTNRSDPSFKSEIWRDYKRAIAWGLDRGKAPAYHQNVRRFDQLSKALESRLEVLDPKASNRSPQKQEVTRLALELYRIADALADPNNFKRFPNYRSIPRLAQVGFFDANQEPGQRPTLPMYEVASKLRGGPLSRDQEMLVSKPRRRAHADALSGVVP